MKKERTIRKGRIKPLGRPKDSGSRQQTHPEQVVQTGSPRLDRTLVHRPTRILPGDNVK